MVQDEVYTLDSSRFWFANDYQKQVEQLRRGEIGELNPRSLSKEFAREKAVGNQKFTQEQLMNIAVRYILAVQPILGKPFHPDLRPRNERVISGLQNIVEHLVA